MPLLQTKTTTPTSAVAGIVEVLLDASAATAPTLAAATTFAPAAAAASTAATATATVSSMSDRHCSLAG